MKPTMQFRLSQHLTLTPQLQQSIRLLQLSTVELNQEIERLLMENPILELEDGESDAAATAGAAGAEPRSALRNVRATRLRAAIRSATRNCPPISPPRGAAAKTAAATTTATAATRRPTCPPCATT